MSTRTCIFLSYASKEIDFALKLAIDLKNAGINLWMDRLDLQPGDDWRKSLQAGIDQSMAVLVILSEMSLQSQYCQREIARADRLGNPIIPILLTPLSAADWPLEIERQQYLDFTHWYDELQYQQQLVLLIDHLRKTFHMSSGAVPDQETQYLTRLVAALKSRYTYDFPARSDERVEPFSTFEWNLEINSASRRKVDSYLRADLLKNQRLSLVEKVLDNFAHRPQLALIGAPGTGKTSLLEYLCLQFAYKRRAAPKQEPLPVLVRLSDWQYDVPLLQFVRQLVPFEVGMAQTVLMLDGLDELAAPGKLAQIRDLLSTDQKLILTCRSQPFAEELNLPGVPTITVHDLEFQQIQTFLNALSTQDRAHQILERFPCQQFQQVLCNPRVLGLVSAAHQQVALENVGVVIRQLVEDLTSYKQHKGADDTLSYPALEQGLARLAFESQPSLPIKQAELLAGSPAVLETSKRAGLLTVSGAQIAFTYPIFRSYFAALWLHRNALDWQHVKDRSDFNCIVLCLAGISPRRDDLVCAIYQDHPELALHCLVTEVASSTVQTVLSHWLRSDHQPDLSVLPDLSTVIKALVSIMRDDPWPMRQAAYKLLQSLNTPILPGIEEMLRLDASEQEDAVIALKQIGTRALPTLIHHLPHPDAEVRLNVVWALEELADRACIPALVAALDDQSVPVVIQAVQALGYQHDPDSFPALITLLGHADVTVQQTVFETLHWMRANTSNALALALDHPHPLVREKAVTLLAEQTEDGVTEVLLKGTYHTHPDVQLGALAALKARESPDVMDRVVECLDIKRLHATALEVLKSFHSPAAHQIVLDTLRPDGPKHSASVAKARLKQAITANSLLETKERPAAMQHAPHALLDQLLARLREAEWGEREETAKALRDYAKTLHGEHVPHILSRLTALLTDEDWIIRWAVVEPIAWIGDTAAVPDLIARLEDGNWTVRVAAVRGLQALQSPAAVDAILARLDDPNAIVREAAIEAVGALGGERMIPVLAELLDNPDEMFRLAAVQALAHMQEKPAQRYLEKALTDSDKHVRWAAIGGLRRIADESMVETLILRLGDTEKPHWEDDRICDLAARLLEQIGTEQARAAVAEWKQNRRG